MKQILCITFLFCLACAKNDLPREFDLVKVHQECQANPATKLDEALFTKLRHGENVKDKSIEAHLFCQSIKLGFQEMNGEINKDQLKNYLKSIYDNTNKVNEIIEECTTINPDQSKFETAENLFKCLHRNYERNRKEQYTNIFKECRSNDDTKVDRQFFDKFQRGEKVDDPQLPKYVLCLTTKLGIQLENGDANKEILKKDLEIFLHDEEKTEKIINKCSVRNEGDSPTARAVKLFTCVYLDGMQDGHRDVHHENYFGREHHGENH